MSTVAIVGMGWVGSSVAMSTLHAGLASKMLLCDVRQEIAEGEAMDLAHGAPFYPHAEVRAGKLDEMPTADVVVIAAGRGSKAGESRLQLLRDNVAVARDLGSRLRNYRGIVVCVTNPVDIFTQEVLEAAVLPVERVIGTGTTLDTARLRHVLARSIGIDARSIHAQVVGEHGDSEVALFSSATVGGARLRSRTAWSKSSETKVASEVRRAAYEIIKRKGATNHAIGLATADLLRSILRSERRVLTVSRMHGDTVFSLPCVVDRGGAVEVIMPDMDEPERAALEKSIDALRQARSSLV